MTRLIPILRLLALPTLWLAVAANASACLTPNPVGFYWQNCNALNVYLDASLGSIAAGPSTTPADQIQSAVNLWASTIPSMYPSVNITVNVVGSAALANVIVNAAPLNPGTGASQPRQNGGIIEQTITFNTGFSSADPTQSGYQILFFKMALHEFGHVFGLADLAPIPCNAYSIASIMDQVCGTNDEQQGIATAPTTCDIDEITFVYQDDPCGGGGGGCETCQDGTCLEDDVCPCGDSPGSCTDWIGGCQRECSPIVMDAFNEGFHLTSVANGVKFRTLPGGPLYQMSWTDPNWRNGWLALDRNGNGTIDDFTELFGNLTAQPPSKTPNGFLALAVFDEPANGGNGNGFIDPGDAVYSRLRVWIDANHNGISEPGELHTLQELGILKIGLSYVDSPFVDQYGNQFRYQGYAWDDGGTQKNMCYDVFLQVRPK
jgi:hypothetical protein